MADGKRSTNYSSPLRVEALEEREVPASFGTAGGLSVAFADVMPGDGQNEYITATGPGREALVRVWSQAGVERARFDPFPGFRGGVYLATGDVDNDGNTELICSTAPGTVGQVKIYAFRNGGLQQLASFVPFGFTYSGGVQIATGNVTGDHASEIIVGQQQASPTVKVYAFDSTVGQAFEIRSFQAYGPNYHGGVTVAAANIDIKADSLTDPYEYNYAEIITGRTSQLPQVKIFDAQAQTVITRASYMAFDISNPANRVGINVAAGSTDGIRGAEIYVALKNVATIRIFNGYTSGFLGKITPYPPNYSKVVNFYVNTGDDDFNGIFSVGSLITVSGTGPSEQIPIVYPGRLASPAGLNGSFPAA